MTDQQIFSLPEVCARYGVRNVVISPGSRCAPLVLAFCRHPEFDPLVIPDERAAAYIALGLSLASGEPSVLICTSGTATLNYAPAVAEAWYQGVPLILLTADRPPESIDQLDNQAIHQENMFDPYVKTSFVWPINTGNNSAIRLADQACALATTAPYAPVHINIPFREPFYPAANQGPVLPDIEVGHSGLPPIEPEHAQLESLISLCRHSSSILVVVGQHVPSSALRDAVLTLVRDPRVIVLCDITSNLPEHKASCRLADLYLNPDHEDAVRFVPELMIYVGGPVLSKKLKNFYRFHAPRDMWRIQLGEKMPDTFGCMTGSLRAEPAMALSRIARSVSPDVTDAGPWRRLWNDAEASARNLVSRLVELKSDFNELKAMNLVMKHLPDDAALHLGSSLPVRWADMIGRRDQPGACFSNRGTSGIDGCVPTAVGAALADSTMNVLVCGDMTFQYGRNAFWHNYELHNLVVIVLNNGGGGIFKMIEGPSAQPECEEYFVTRQSWTAESAASDKGMVYLSCNDEPSLSSALNDLFCHDSRGKVLEIFVDLNQSRDVYQRLRKQASAL